MKKLLFTVAVIALITQSVFSQSATNVAENDLLALVFQNAGVDSIGDVTGLRGSTSADSLYTILLTGNPGEAGALTDSCRYTGFRRVGTIRSGAGWVVSNDSAWNAAAITFPEATGGTETVTHFAVVWRNKVYFYGTLLTPLSISSGITPRFQTKNLIVTLN